MKLNPKTQPGILIPEINEDTAFWWNALGNHELYVQYCDACGKSWFASVINCPYCANPEWQWKKSSGLGTVYSWVVYHRAFEPSFAEEIPYSILTVRLEEGAKMFGRLISEGEDQEIEADMQVQAIFYKQGSHTLVGFKRVQ